MSLRKNILLTSLVFIVLATAITFVLALLSDYKYNVVSYVGDPEHRNQLQNDLDIDDKYFLLTPKLYINFKLRGLEYVEDVDIDRVMPNQVTVDYKTVLPLFCDTESMYFTNTSLLKDVNNQGECLNIPKIIQFESFDNYLEFVEVYKKLGIDFRYNLSTVEEVDNYYEFTMNDGLVIKVFLNDFDKLNKFDEYMTENNMLDLRPKYS